jgi:hypothetical protein
MRRTIVECGLLYVGWRELLAGDEKAIFMAKRAFHLAGERIKPRIAVRRGLGFLVGHHAAVAASP